MPNSNTVNAIFVFDDYPCNNHDGIPTSEPIGYLTWRSQECQLRLPAGSRYETVFDFDALDIPASADVGSVDKLVVAASPHMSRAEAMRLIDALYDDVRGTVEDQPQNWQNLEARYSSRL